MSFKDQVVNLIIKGKDLFSSEAKKSEKALAELAQQSEILNDRLQELDDLQGAIGAVDELTRSINKGEKAFINNSTALDALVKEQKKAVADAKQLEAAQKGTALSTAKLETEYKQAAAELAAFDTQIASARLAVERLTATQNKGSQASQKQAQALAKAKDDLKQLETAQKNTAVSANKLATELEREQIELKRLDAQVENASRAKAEYTLKVKEARSELNKLGSGVIRNKAELEKQQAVLRKAGVNMDKLADASKELKQQQAAAEKALSGVNNKLGLHNAMLGKNKAASAAANLQTSLTTKAVQTLAKAYAALLSAQQAVAAVKTGVENYGELEAAITKVEKTTGNARESVVKMAAELKELGENVTPTSTNELLRMAEVAGQLGTKSTEDILNLVAAADALGLSTNLAGDEAATMLARILGMTREGIPEIQNLSSSVVALGNDFAVTEADIVHMTKEIVSGTREINLGSAASAAFGATLAELGQPAERSRTAIQRLGAQINEASKKGGDSLERLTKITGLTAKQIEQDLGQAPEKVLVKFLEGLQKVKSEGGLVSDSLKAMGIEGTEATGVLSVLADGTDRLKTALELSNKAYIAGDYHMKEAAKAYADQESAIGRLENKFHNLGSEIGQAFSDETDTAIRAAGAALDAVDQNAIELMERLPEIGQGFVDLLGDVNNFTAGTSDAFETLDLSLGVFASGLNAVQVITNSLTLELSDLDVKQKTLLAIASKISGIEYVTADQVNDAKQRSQEIRDAITRDLNDITTQTKRMNGESSIAYEGLIKTSAKYRGSLDKLSIAQRNQLNDILLSGKYNQDLEKTYRELTASLVRANRETEIEVELKTKAAEASKKKAEEDKKAAEQNEANAESQAKVNTNTLNYADAVAEVERKQLELNQRYNDGAISADDLVRSSAALHESLKAYNQEVDASNQKTSTQAELTAEFLAKRKELQAQYEQGLLTEKDLIIAQQELAISYDKTTAQANESANTTGLLSDAQLTLQDKIVRTEAEIRKLEKALNDENKATAELIIIKAKLAKEEANLAELKRDAVELAKIENSTYVELLVLQREYQTQLEILDRSFKAGLLTKQEYDSQSQTLKDTLSEINKVVGENTKKTGENTKEVKANSAALRDNTAAGVEHIKVIAAQLSSVDDLRNSQADLRSVFLDSGRVYANTSASVEELTKQLNELGTSYLSNEQKRQRSELSASLRIAKLIDQVETGSISVSKLDNIAQQATHSMHGLSGVQLNPLIGAIDRAKDRLDAMRQSADDTLTSLRDELDNLQGNDLAIQQREYERKLAEIREQLKAAQQSGDDELLAQLKESEQLLQRINKIRTAEIKAEAAANTAAKPEKTTSTTSQPEPAKAPTPTPPVVSQPTPAPVVSSEVVTLRLQVGPAQLDLKTQKNLLNQLMDEIKRQQRLGA